MPIRDLLLFGIIAGLVPVILRRPWVGVLAWFWIGLMVPHRMTWGFMFDFPVAMVVALSTLAGMVFARDRQPLPLTREMFMIGVFAAYITMTTTFAVSPGAWTVWEKLMKILLMTVVTPILVFGPKRILALLLVMTGSLAFHGLKGGWFTLSTGGEHMVLGPRDSFLEGNTSLGLAMLMILPAVLVSARVFHWRLFDFDAPRLEQWMRPIGIGIYVVFWLTAIAILATYSRGAFLGILLIAPFMFWHMNRKPLLITAAVFLVAVIGVTVPDRLAERWETIQNYEQDQSSMQRIQAWGVNWNIAVENPIMGSGFNSAGAGYDWYRSYANFEGAWQHALSAHSIYFQVMGHHGFGGLAVFLGMVGFTFLSLNRVRRVAKQRQEQLWLSEYAWALQVGLIGYLGAGAFLDVAYFDLFYAFLAVAVIMRRELGDALPEAAHETDRAVVPATRSEDLQRKGALGSGGVRHRQSSIRRRRTSDATES